MQGPSWYQDTEFYPVSMVPPFPIEKVPERSRPPRAVSESQCRSFLPYTLAKNPMESACPESPYSNVDDIDAQLWDGPLPCNEDDLER
jgi:hypothetical protein